MKRPNRRLAVISTVIISTVISMFGMPGIVTPLFGQALSNEEFLQQKQMIAVVSVASVSDLKKAAASWTIQTRNTAGAGLLGAVRKAAQGDFLDSIDRKQAAGAVLLYDRNGFPTFLPIAFVPSGNAEEVAKRLATPVPASVVETVKTNVTDKVAGTINDQLPENVSVNVDLPETLSSALEGKIEPWNCCGLTMTRVQFTTPTGNPALFLRSEGGWTFISTVDAALIDVPENPAELLSDLPKRYLMGYRINGQLLAEVLPEFLPQYKDQLQSLVKDQPLTLCRQIEGGFVFDTRSGSLYSEFRVEFPEGSPALSWLRSQTCENLRYSYVLQSDAILSFCLALGEEKSIGGFADFSQTGIKIGALFDTPVQLEPASQALYEAAAHSQGITVGQNGVETYVLQRGRFVLTGVGVEPVDQPKTIDQLIGNQLQLAAAVGRGTGNQKESVFVLGSGARQALEDIVSVRYAKNPTIVSDWDRQWFYTQLRLGRNISGYTFTRDRLSVKLGLDGTCLVGRFEIEKDVLSAVTARLTATE